jgi:uncharacterized protein (DUF58 family)
MRFAPFAELRRRLNQRVLAWALRRQGRDRLPLTLRPRRIYILPTRAGWVFTAMVAVAFFAGLNYGNGLAMLLAFWLAGFLGVAMLHTHRNLSGAVVLEASAAPAFAGSAVTIALSLTTPADAADINLQASSQDGVASAETLALPHPCVRLHLSLPAPQRGPWHSPTLRMETSAPFGLFRTWTWVQLDVTTLIYPRPVGKHPEPLAEGGEPGRADHSVGLDELASLRPFREGDSPRQVAWKAFARGAPLLVREYRGNAQAAQEFSFDQLAGMGTEARLSQLCRWVIDASARRQAYTLRLPGAPLLQGNGARHRVQCLSELALFGNPPGKQT